MLGAGNAGASYFRKQSNRQKAMKSFKEVRGKAWGKKNTLESAVKKATYPDPYEFPDNEMGAEGSCPGSNILIIPNDLKNA
ncbi:hypothetical protein CVD28_14060 [Bacillus sp. M6-12]|uniref:hypothetical protein n=1 Tax=Bacillus sp. M6-12 TaxID=2054166 RepID=UPI000C76883A|nr:hypothetical protein [Bacillus sp. M6-12]PLS17172.1 hypothetical protein CVD28_14060 [Bacillus sp. M6-12]